jgi:formylglycine-generating enzyme required for sulfatase activity
MNHIFGYMKNVYAGVIILLLALSVFGQGKVPKSAHHTKGQNKPNTQPSAALNPKLSEILKTIDASMVKVEGGGFIMGCTDEQDTDCYYWENPAHVVKLNSFYISKFDVTQRQWQTVMGTAPWWSKNCDDCPVENVTWYDVQLFINKINQVTGDFYRLPTEAEWEFAARGGNKFKGNKYPGTNDVYAVAWIDKNSNRQTHPVGKKQPNELGLYDMSGNVWQWCADWFDDQYYKESPASNPEGPRKGSYRVLRGGSWWEDPDNCRVSNRDRYPPDAGDDDVGFRLARD